jgi:RNA polymerase-binding protein DksA
MLCQPQELEMTKEFVAEIERVLTEQRAELLGNLTNTNAAFRALTEEGGEIGDVIDEAADTVDRKMLEALGTKDFNRLQFIDSALSRVHQGKYGLCVACGKPIPEARLRAIPHAVLCVDCKVADERRNR